VDYDGDRYGFYYQTSYDFGHGDRTHRLTLAVDHERDEYQQRGPVTFGDPNQNQKMDNTGLVAEYLLQPLDALNLSASARYDDNSDFDSEATYRFAGSWRIESTGTRLRASAGKGQKSPTFTERFGFFPGDFVGNPSLQPEKSIGFDVGLVQTAVDGQLRLDLTWFYDKVDDEINGFVFDPATGSFTAGNENGTSHRRGVEVALQARLAKNLDGSASYTYTNAKEPDPVNGGNRREIRRPRHMAAGNLNYRFLDERANLNLNVSYSGKQKDEYFPPPDFAQTGVQLDDYTLVDLVLSYDLNDGISIYARAENLLDEDYENVLGYATPGAGYYAGLRMRLR
jgi:vitamin B12 transporter